MEACSHGCAGTLPILVMFWWEKAANAVRAGHSRRFGLITTNEA